MFYGIFELAGAQTQETEKLVIFRLQKKQLLSYFSYFSGKNYFFRSVAAFANPFFEDRASETSQPWALSATSSTAAHDWKTPVLARSPRHGGQPLHSVCTDSSGEVRYTIHFARAIFVISPPQARNSHIALLIHPGLEDARFRATRAFPASWWTTAALGLV